MAKAKLSPQDFGQVAKAVPNMTDLLQAAPKVEGLGGAMRSSAGGTVGGGMGKHARKQTHRSSRHARRPQQPCQCLFSTWPGLRHDRQVRCHHATVCRIARWCYHQKPPRRCVTVNTSRYATTSMRQHRRVGVRRQWSKVCGNEERADEYAGPIEV